MQIGSIKNVAVVVLDKGLALRVPPFCHNLFVDLVTHFQPTVSVSGKREFISQTSTTVNGDPTHEL
jgi:hypothetical protein